jgi:hypothetical protein
MSLREPTTSPLTCSGLMYVGVPIRKPVPVTFVERLSTDFAIPKSTIFATSPPKWSRVIKMLSGFKSR